MSVLIVADLQHGLCARDNDVSTLEGKLDELEQQLATVKHCLSEKEQELCAAQQNILDNNVSLLEFIKFVCTKLFN